MHHTHKPLTVSVVSMIYVLFLETELSCAHTPKIPVRMQLGVCVCPPAWVHLNSSNWMWMCVHGCMVWNSVRRLCAWMTKCFLVNVCNDHVCRYVCTSASEFGIVFFCLDGLCYNYCIYIIYDKLISSKPQPSNLISFVSHFMSFTCSIPLNHWHYQFVLYV